jgi:hypothetical protein
MKSEFHKKIINKLDSFSRKEYIHKTFNGIIDSLSQSLIFLFAIIILEFLFNFSSLVRTIFFFVWVFLSLILIVNAVLIPFAKAFNIFRANNYFEIAKRTGSFYPHVKDDLINSLQLVSNNAITQMYSLTLIDEAFRRVFYKVEKLNFEDFIDYKSLKNKFTRFVLTLIPFSLLLSINGGFLSAANRVFDFNTEFIPPQEFYFEIYPGNIQIPKGASVDIKISIIGKQLISTNLLMKSDDETDYKKIQLIKDSIGNFNYKVPTAIKSFKYYAEAEGIQSSVFYVDVTDYPLIKTLTLKLYPPAYSKIPGSEQYDNGNITALKGTRVELNITASKQLKEAFIEFSDSVIVPLQLSGNSAKGSFQIRDDVSYVIRIKDLLNNYNQQPISYSIKSLYDEFPFIELASPLQDFDLSEDNRVPIFFKIQDDYGFSKLLLNYRRYSIINKSADEDFDSFEILIDKNLKEQLVNHIWNITPLSPSVNDIFSFYIEIFDNDIISGPKSSKTNIINFRIPTLEELLAKVNNTQDDVQKQLEQTFKEAHELKKELEQISRELKQDRKELKWEEKQRIEKALNKFESLQDEMQNLAEKMQDVQNELQQNKLLSKETLEKYMQLQELMSEMTNDEMKKALEQLRQNLEQLNRNLTQQQLQEFQFDEERLRKTIERTMNLLKRIQVEQKIDELVKRTEKLSENIEEIKNQLEKNPSDQTNKNQLVQKQDKITEELEKMKESIEDLDKKMEELDDVPKDELQKLKEEFEKQKNEELSKEASSKMKQNQMQGAKQNQQQLSKNTNQLQKMMQEMKDAMMQQNQIQTFTDMMRITENLISLSKKQESLKNKTQKLDLNSSQFNENAKQQNEIRDNLKKILEQMVELSKKTFAITPEMGKALGDAERNMNQSISSLQNRNSMASAFQQQEAMGNLNQAIMSLKNQMESMMQGGGGSQGGLMSLLQQLQQLSGQQMSLNNLTQMLQQMQQGQLSLQQQAELQRLAQQQELIKKSIEQLNREAQESGISKKLPVNLEQLAKQMQEVITQMQSQKLDDQLIQKQERILSRLLDSQKSINERDFQQERQGFTGQEILRKGPDKLNHKRGQKDDKIRQELIKYLREGYNKDYEELIKKYFELLQSESQSN